MKKNEADQSPRTKVGKLIASAKSNWIAILGAIGTITGGSWAVYRFYSDRTVPVNISVSLASEVDSTGKGEGGVSAMNKTIQVTPIRIKFSAENNGNFRKLKILNPIWLAFGYTLEKPVDEQGRTVDNLTRPQFAERLNMAFGNLSNDNEMQYTDRRFADFSYRKETIGAGTLLGNDDIGPHEVLKSEHILPVQRNKYDFVKIKVLVPTINNSKGAKDVKVALRLDPDDKTGQVSASEPRISFFRYGMPLSKHEASKYEAQIQTSVGELWLDNRDANEQR
jgi:hypothetical protein